MNPRTDIIVLVHNNLNLTKGFIEKVFENTENFNLIFVDNGSTDGTNEFLTEGEIDKKWKLITSDKNLGVIGGRNLGAKHVTSEYFLNIDNDQYPRKGWLEGLHSLMNEGYDVVGCEAWQIHPPKTPGSVMLGDSSVPDRGYFPFKHCKNPKDRYSYIGCGGMLIKKHVYDQIGLFDDRFSPAYFEDPDFSWRCIKAGFKLGWKYNCPIDHLAHQTFNSQNLFQKNHQFVKSWLEFRKKWLPFYPDLMQM